MADRDSHAIRREKRRARRALEPAERRAAEAEIERRIRHLQQFRKAERVGAFMAFDGEPDLSGLFDAEGHRDYFVPIVSDDAMRFAALGGRQRRNMFGIEEPLQPRFIAPMRLDLVLTPLVAFDDHGVRIGVGRGYYDRCFSFLNGRRHWRRPRLLGVAFECQRVEALEARAWDVPLWGVVTERATRLFNTGSNQ